MDGGVSGTPAMMSNWAIFKSAFHKARMRVRRVGARPRSRIVWRRCAQSRVLDAAPVADVAQDNPLASHNRRWGGASQPRGVDALFCLRTPLSDSDVFARAAGILAAVGVVGYLMSVAEHKLKEEKARQADVRKHAGAAAAAGSRGAAPPFVPMHR